MPSLYGYAVAFVINCAILNGSGAYVMQHASAVNRSIFRQLSIVLIWVFFLSFKGTGHETFSGLQLGGYILLLIGVILFNLSDWSPLFRFLKFRPYGS